MVHYRAYHFGSAYVALCVGFRTVVSLLLRLWSYLRITSLFLILFGWVLCPVGPLTGLSFIMAFDQIIYRLSCCRYGRLIVFGRLGPLSVVRTQYKMVPKTKYGVPYLEHVLSSCFMYSGLLVALHVFAPPNSG